MSGAHPHVGVPLPCLPFEPLRKIVQGRIRADDAARLGDGLASLGWLHNSWQHRAWRRAEIAGTVTVAAADRLACDLGLHPSEIWPGWWTVVARLDAERDARLRTAHSRYETLRRKGIRVADMPAWVRDGQRQYNAERMRERRFA